MSIILKRNEYSKIKKIIYLFITNNILSFVLQMYVLNFQKYTFWRKK